MLKILLLPLAVLVVIAAGCSDDDETSTTATTTIANETRDDAGDVAAEIQLTVVVHGGEFDELTYTITCSGAAATVEPQVDGVDPVAACQRLEDREVVQRLVEGPPADRICTEQYGGPQVATITGTIDGEAVDAEVSRVNGCEISTWDDQLTGLLPPTEGATAGE